VVSLQEIAPGPVAEFRRLLSGTDDVGEQDGPEDAVEDRLLRADGRNELIDLL
jgi:hypothetical protein